VTTRWRHRSGWPADPVVQPVARPVENMPRWVELGWFFFLCSTGCGPGFHGPGHSPKETSVVEICLYAGKSAEEEKNLVSLKPLESSKKDTINNNKKKKTPKFDELDSSLN
jgi:hypothetical protein